MTDSNIFKLTKPEQSDPLQEVLREGARKMLAAAIETEVFDFIKQHSSVDASLTFITVDATPDHERNLRWKVAGRGRSFFW